MTIYLANRNARDDRKKSAVHLRAAAMHITGIQIYAWHALEDIRGGADMNRTYAKLHLILEAERKYSSLNEVNLSDFPDPESLEAWAAMLPCVGDLKTIVSAPDRAANRSPSYVEGLLESMEAAKAVLLINAERLEGVRWIGK